MQIFFITLGAFAVLMSAMAIGVIFSDKELKGSCGGIGTSCACDEAGTPGACKSDPFEEKYVKPGDLIQL